MTIHILVLCRYCKKPS